MSKRELIGERGLELQSAPPWFAGVDIRGLSDYCRRAILQRVKDKRIGGEWKSVRVEASPEVPGA